MPRDRKSAFEPQTVVKGQRRVGQVDDMILSLYARGMPSQDIEAHLAGVYGAEVSLALVPAVTDVVADEITEWQNRPLDAFTRSFTSTRWWSRSGTAARWTTRVPIWSPAWDADGFKHVLGIWLAGYWRRDLVLLAACTGCSRSNSSLHASRRRHRLPYVVPCELVTVPFRAVRVASGGSSPG